jgi:FixJ family two-component response regulator
MHHLQEQAMCRVEGICKPLWHKKLAEPTRGAAEERQFRPASRAEARAAHATTPSAARRSRNVLSAAVRTCETRDSVTCNTSAICRSVSSS